MTIKMPDCFFIATGHCEVCVAGSMTCCECGQAMVPWHPHIEYLWKDGLVR